MTAANDSVGNWFVVIVNPSCERLVAGLLGERGYETFVPMFTKSYTIRGHRKTMPLPLFPRYVLCRITTQSTGKLIGTPKVQRLLGFEGGLGSISDTEVKGLRRLLEYGVLSVDPLTTAGHMVEVTSGPLAGVVGRVTRDAEKRRVVLSVDLIGQAVSVEVDRADIAPYLST